MMNERKKFYALLNIFIVLFIIFIYTFVSVIPLTVKTNTRYIKKETDEIRGYYTSLYFDATGEGNCIVLENNIGYTSFDLMNYIGEDVTKRDIEYNVRTLTEFYDKNGNVITNPSDSDSLYVLDVWNKPQLIQGDTYKYEYEVVSNTAEKSTDDKHPYLFSYQPNGTSAIGKKHALTVKLTRKSEYSTISQIENISIVVELSKPYKEVYIINMVVVNRLIAFASVDKTQFEVGFKSLNIQTADIFARQIKMGEDVKKIGTKAFKVTLKWDGLILDKRDLSIIHNTADLDEIIKALNGESASNIDITKPYIISLKYDESDISSGELELFIPQSSNFNLDFFPTNDLYNVFAKVEILDINESSATYNDYILYDSSFGGYTEYEFSKAHEFLIYVLGNSTTEKLVH